MGHVVASPVQEDFRIRDGDDVGLNVNSDWLDTQNSDGSFNVDTAFRVRIQLAEVNGANFSDALDLLFSYNGGAYEAVGAIAAGSKECRYIASGHFTHGDATTDILTAGSGSFVAGDGVTQNNFGPYNLSSEHTEIEACLEIVSGLVSNGDTIALRLGVTGTGNDDLDAYDNTPTITAIETAAGGRSVFIIS